MYRDSRKLLKMNNKNITKLLIQHNKSFTFNVFGSIITVTASTPKQAEVALVKQLKRNN